MKQPILTPDQQKQILDIALIKGDFTFASGLKASEKFEFDNILSGSAEFDLLVDKLSKVVRVNFGAVDAIVTVANGAIRLGGPIASKLGIVHIPTAYNEGPTKDFYLHGPIEATVKSIVIVDDVYTKGTTTSKVGTMLSAAGKSVKGAVVICDRSDYHEPTFSIGDELFPVYSLIKHHMPVEKC